MKILHMIRRSDDAYPLEMMALQAAEGQQITLLLLHDAVLKPPAPSGVAVVACKEDAAARGAPATVPRVGYDDMVRLIFEHDSVINW